MAIALPMFQEMCWKTVMIREFNSQLYHHTKVRVYRNLNNGLVSVQVKGKVVGHTDNLAIANVTLIVSECLRVKMVAENRRKVHAYAEGILLPSLPDIPLSHTLHYNPYRGGYFTRRPGEEVVKTAEYVVVRNNVVYVYTEFGRSVATANIQQLSLF
jgi:hypothetical protein